MPSIHMEIVIYTDGACSGNPGPGGWGVVLQAFKDRKLVKERTLHGGEEATTNNRMELRAAIEALNALRQPSKVCVKTDSKYVHDGITHWIHTWKRNQWKTRGEKPVKNAELWRQLDESCNRHQDVKWQWVKGHANEPGNEKADQLARRGMFPFLKVASKSP